MLGSKFKLYIAREQNGSKFKSRLILRSALRQLKWLDQIHQCCFSLIKKDSSAPKTRHFLPFFENVVMPLFFYSSFPLKILFFSPFLIFFVFGFCCFPSFFATRLPPSAWNRGKEQGGAGRLLKFPIFGPFHRSFLLRCEQDSNRKKQLWVIRGLLATCGNPDSFFFIIKKFQQDFF